MTSEPGWSAVREGGGRLDVDAYTGLDRVGMTVENATTSATFLLTKGEARRLGRYLISISRTEPSDV